MSVSHSDVQGTQSCDCYPVSTLGMFRAKRSGRNAVSGSWETLIFHHFLRNEHAEKCLFRMLLSQKFFKTMGILGLQFIF